MKGPYHPIRAFSFPSVSFLIVGPNAHELDSFSAVAEWVQARHDFDVTGNNVIAGGFGSDFCNNIASGFEFGFGGLATVVIPEEPALSEAERGICCCSCLRTFIPISADKA